MSKLCEICVKSDKGYFSFYCKSKMGGLPVKALSYQNLSKGSGVIIAHGVHKGKV